MPSHVCHSSPVRQTFHYLSQSSCTQITNVSDKSRFQELITAMRILGIDDEQQV